MECRREYPIIEALRAATPFCYACGIILRQAGAGEIQKGECGLAGFTYKEQYAVVVICEDEKQQEAVYNRLKEEGHKCKVVAV